MVLRKLLNIIDGQKQQERKAELYRNLIRHEAKIGGQLFGPVPEGTKREFFCLDEHTWVWHEEWIDSNGQRQTKMTRYDVRPDGVIKAQDGRYQSVSETEARNLLRAAKIYEQRVNSELYSFAG
jgi:hypothetical protein